MIKYTKTRDKSLVFLVTANIDTYKTILYIHKMTKNIYLKYLSFLAAAGLMSYALYRTVKSVNEIDRLLNENYGNKYSTDYFPYYPDENTKD